MALFQQRQDMDADEKMEEGAERMSRAVPTTTADPIATLGAASVLFAWYKFYVQGDKQAGIFVGLWAPTMFAAAGYLQQKDLVSRLKRGLSSL